MGKTSGNLFLKENKEFRREGHGTNSFPKN